MKIIISPQSFKGSLTANEAADCIYEAALNIFPDAKLLKLPIADGGDGTLEALADRKKGEILKSNVVGPLREKIDAEWGILSKSPDKLSIIEMARSSGLALLDPAKLDPVNATSFGTGQLILDAINHGAKKIILGIGGSATNDCGVGAAQALGVKFITKKGIFISDSIYDFKMIEAIDLSKLHPKISNIDIEVACDVVNTLCGDEGASYIYGPQKGANNDQVKLLDECLFHLSKIIKKDIGIDVLTIKGGGAAGGMGAGMVAFFNANLRPGVDIIFETLNIENQIKDADLIITGEGQFDISSTYNKAPSAIGKLGMKYNIPTLGVSGSFGNGFEKLDEYGILSKYSLINQISNLETNIKNAKKLLKIAIQEQLKAVKIGMNL